MYIYLILPFSSPCLFLSLDLFEYIFVIVSESTAQMRKFDF